jgi:hypothetical protein
MPAVMPLTMPPGAFVYDVLAAVVGQPLVVRGEEAPCLLGRAQVVRLTLAGDLPQRRLGQGCDRHASPRAEAAQVCGLVHGRRSDCGDEALLLARGLDGHGARLARDAAVVGPLRRPWA